MTGSVALLVERKPELATRPEELRAILQASSRHPQIEGVRVRTRARAILLDNADDLVASELSDFFVRPGGTEGFPIDVPFEAAAGEVTRVAIAWSHKAGVSTSEPSTDLDLLVLDPMGATAASSTSRDNNYENVEFVAPLTGTYTARIINLRSSPGAEYVGIAISPPYSGLCCK